MNDKSNTEKNEMVPFIILVPESPQTSSIEIFSKHGALKMAVVERNGLGSLKEADWKQPGVYILLSRHDSNGNWSAYVGKATGLKTRIPNHEKTKDWWYQALLIQRDTTHGFNSAEIGWLEGRIHGLLKAAERCELKNKNSPGDETLPPYDLPPLEELILPIRRVLMMLGHDPATADDAEEHDSESRSSPRKSHSVTVAQLVEKELLEVGKELVSTYRAWPAIARVDEHSKIEFNGTSYDTPSGAAQVAREGKNTNGWEFWAVQTESGKVSLAILRAEFMSSNEGTKT